MVNYKILSTILYVYLFFFYFKNKYKTQDNIYQPRPPQGTSNIARGVGLLIQEKIETNSRKKLEINRNKVEGYQYDIVSYITSISVELVARKWIHPRSMRSHQIDHIITSKSEFCRFTYTGVTGPLLDRSPCNYVQAKNISSVGKENNASTEYIQVR